METNGSDLQFVAQPRSKLLSAPAELRNHIYELALTSKYLSIRKMRPERYDVSSRYRQTRCRSLDLLLTCRQFYAEAEGVFYELNHLEYEAQSTIPGTYLFRHAADGGPFERDLTHFIPSLSIRRQEALRIITLTSPCMELALEELTVRLLPLATNLHTLNLKLPLRDLFTVEDAVAWAAKMQVALRATSVKEVKVRDCRAQLRRERTGVGAHSPQGRMEELAQIIEEMLGSDLRNWPFVELISNFRSAPFHSD